MQVPDLQQQVAALKLQLAAEANTSSALRTDLSTLAHAAPDGAMLSCPPAPCVGITLTQRKDVISHPDIPAQLLLTSQHASRIPA